MKKHWLAVISDQDLNIAKIAVGKNNEIKILYYADYKGNESLDDESPVLEAKGVKAWLQHHGVPLRNLKLATSCLGLITRVISLPHLSNEDLDKLITDHIDQFLTLNIHNYVIDYRILEKYRENDKAMVKLLLAAFPKERMEYIWSMCQEIGFEPGVVDVTADCLVRIYSKLVRPMEITSKPESAKQGSNPGDMAIVSLQRDKAEFILMENSVFFLYSDMEMDFKTVAKRFYTTSQQMTAILSEERKAAFKHGILTPTEPEDEIKLELSSYMDEAVELYLEEDTQQELINIPDEEKDYCTRIPRVNQAADSFFRKESVRLTEDSLSDQGIKLLDEHFGDDDYQKNDILNHELEAKLKEQSDLLFQLIGLEQQYMPSKDNDSRYEEVFSDDGLFEAKSVRELHNLNQTSMDKYFGDMQGSVEVENENEHVDLTLNLTKNLSQLDFTIAFDQQHKEEKDSFRQATLKIGQHGRNDEKFILEDLYVPADQLSQELVIKKSHQELNIFTGQINRPKRIVPEWEILQREQEISQLEIKLVSDQGYQTELDDISQTTVAGTALQSYSEDGVESEITGLNANTRDKPQEERNIFDTLDLHYAMSASQKPEVLPIPADPREELENSLAPVLTTLSELLGFFAARHFGQNVNSIYLTGDYATLPFLEEIFEANLGVKTVVGFPNGWKPQFDKMNEPLSESWKKYGSLYGLALRGD